MAEHTQEPWFYEQGHGFHTGSTVITSQAMNAKSPLAHISNVGGVEEAEADAKRIVQCVNALAGLPNDSLDGGWSALGMSQYAKGLETQRDELVEGLERLKDAFMGSDWQGVEIYDTTMELIDKAKK